MMKYISEHLVPCSLLLVPFSFFRLIFSGERETCYGSSNSKSCAICRLV